MTDRELLEMAAKAASMEIDWEGDRALTVQMFRGHLKNWFDWNPFEDDGEALRLAVKLGLTISPYPVYEQPKHSVIVDVKAHSECPSSTPPLRFCAQCTDPCQLKKQIAETEPYGQDPYAATRRAIVLAAAEIGKELK